MNYVLMVVSVLLVGILTAAATSVRAVSRLWLRHWIERRSGGVAAMGRYLERPTRLVHAAGTGIMLTVFATGALLVGGNGERPWSLTADVIVYLVLLVFGGQLLPRAIGRRWAPQVVPVFVPLLRIVDLVVTPFQRLADGARRVVTGAGHGAPVAEEREGLDELLRDGAFAGISTTEEMAIISGVVQFGDKSVADVMTPRSELFALSEALTPKALAEQVAQSGYSRVPVFRESLDQIVGMIHVFDVFKRAGERLPPLRPITTTPPGKAANELLFELLRARRQVAIVKDGATVVGLVTLEDLLEELVGDIKDEHDDSVE